MYIHSLHNIQPTYIHMLLVDRLGLCVLEGFFKNRLSLSLQEALCFSGLLELFSVSVSGLWVGLKIQFLLVLNGIFILSYLEV
jgi:hypothetical protein